MKRWLPVLVGSMIVLLVSNADAVINQRGLWGLHYAGPHDPLANTCDTSFVSAMDIETDGPSGPGRFDIYVVALQVDGICESRFGVSCAGPVSVYGWTGCADWEDPTAGWPGCGKGVTLGWTS